MTLNLAQRQIMKAIGTVAELEQALLAFSEGNKLEAGTRIERLFVMEVEIDELRRSVFTELTKGTLPTTYREDLKALVGRLDRFADHVKDAARAVKILIDTDRVVPHEIVDILEGMVKTLVECTGFLSAGIEMLGVNPSQAMAFAHKVDASEECVDEAHSMAKISFIKNAGRVDTPTFLFLKDLADAIEHAADMCADTADFISILAAGEV